MTATTAPATVCTTPVRIGNGTVIHAATTDGIVLCGSQRRGRRVVTFLPGEAITCTKCGPTDAPTVAAEPTSERVVADGHCTNPAVHDGQVTKLNRFGRCGICDYL